MAEPKQTKAEAKLAAAQKALNEFVESVDTKHAGVYSSEDSEQRADLKVAVKMAELAVKQEREAQAAEGKKLDELDKNIKSKIHEFCEKNGFSIIDEGKIQNAMREAMQDEVAKVPETEDEIVKLVNATADALKKDGAIKDGKELAKKASKESKDPDGDAAQPGDENSDTLDAQDLAREQRADPEWKVRGGSRITAKDREILQKVALATMEEDESGGTVPPNAKPPSTGGNPPPPGSGAEEGGGQAEAA